MATETADPAEQSRASGAKQPSAGSAESDRGEKRSPTRARPAGAAAQNAPGETVAEAKRHAGKLARQAKDQARTFASRQKDRSADRLGSVANALRHTARHLDDEGEDVTAQYVEQAGDSVEWLSTELRDRDIGSLVGAVEDFARRRPVAFFGGAIIGGLILARFLKSTAESADGDDSDDTSDGFDKMTSDTGASQQGSIL